MSQESEECEKVLLSLLAKIDQGRPANGDGQKETILTEAARITAGPRQRDYDHPRPNHQRIALLWNAYIKIRQHPSADLDAEDVAKMMILLKIARDAKTRTRDNLTDICGYARCLERMRAVDPGGNYAE